ncbi:MAG: hypothetical protein H0U74_18075 [Bradymonadaceae bacterium]|nr:hypothetical protein [Lujinxingiaceae bacterium]
MLASSLIDFLANEPHAVFQGILQPVSSSVKRRNYAVGQGDAAILGVGVQRCVGRAKLYRAGGYFIGTRIARRDFDAALLTICHFGRARTDSA